MTRRILYLVVFLALFLVAPARVLPPVIPHPLSDCKDAIAKLGNRVRLSDVQVDEILRGDLFATTDIEMGANALSYLASTTRLNGVQKADLFERMVDRIFKLTGQVFLARPVSVLNPKILVFSSNSQILVIEKDTGQMYRGRGSEVFKTRDGTVPDIPQDWNFESVKHLFRPLGGPMLTD